MKLSELEARLSELGIKVAKNEKNNLHPGNYIVYDIYSDQTVAVVSKNERGVINTNFMQFTAYETTRLEILGMLYEFTLTPLDQR